MRLPACVALVFIAIVPFGYGAEPTAIKGLPAGVAPLEIGAWQNVRNCRIYVESRMYHVRAWFGSPLTGDCA